MNLSCFSIYLSRFLGNHQGVLHGTERLPSTLDNQISALQSDIRSYKESRGLNPSYISDQTRLIGTNDIKVPSGSGREPLSGTGGASVEQKQKDLQAYLQQQELMVRVWRIVCDAS